MSSRLSQITGFSVRSANSRYQRASLRSSFGLCMSTHQPRLAEWEQLMLRTDASVDLDQQVKKSSIEFVQFQSHGWSRKKAAQTTVL